MIDPPFIQFWRSLDRTRLADGLPVFTFGQVWRAWSLTAAARRWSR